MIICKSYSVIHLFNKLRMEAINSKSKRFIEIITEMDLSMEKSWFWSHTFKCKSLENEVKAKSYTSHQKTRIVMAFVNFILYLYLTIFPVKNSQTYRLVYGIIMGIQITIACISIYLRSKRKSEVVIGYLQFYLMNAFFVITFINTDRNNELRAFYVCVIVICFNYYIYVSNSFILLSLTCFIIITSLIVKMTVVNMENVCGSIQESHSPEFVATLGMLLTYIIKSWSNESLREIVCKIKGLEAMHNYYQSFLNESSYKMISVFDNSIVFVNKSLKDKLKCDDLSESNVDQMTENYLKSLSKIKNEKFEDIAICQNKNSSLKEYIESITAHFTGQPSEKSMNINLGFFSSTDAITGIKSCYEVQIRVYPLLNKKIILDVFIHNMTKAMEIERIQTETKIKQKVFSKIAHEFKTPLIIICNELQEFKDLILSNPGIAEEKCRLLFFLSQYCQFLVEDIIHYSCNYRNLKLKTENISNLEEILLFCFNVSQSYQNYYPISSKDNVQIIFDYDAQIKDITLYSDSTRLKQILLNLLSNSVKFTRKGYIKMEFEFISSENKGIITIRDTGIGMSSKIISKLQSMEESGEMLIDIESDYNIMGSGIGLSICMFLVRSLENHAISIESVENEGTQIKLSFPAKLGLVHTSDKLGMQSKLLILSPRKQRLLNSPDLSSTQALRPDSNYMNFQFSLEDFEIETFNFEYQSRGFEDLVVIIDDCYHLRKALRKHLQGMNINNKFSIIELDDGIDLLFFMKKYNNCFKCENTVKLILIDENMQYMKGSESVRILKELEMQNKINKAFIVSVTAFTDDETLRGIRNSGVNKVINKPVTKESLQIIMLEAFAY